MMTKPQQIFNLENPERLTDNMSSCWKTEIGSGWFQHQVFKIWTILLIECAIPGNHEKKVKFWPLFEYVHM